MNLLKAVLYDPAVAVSKATSSLIAMTAFDTTNLRLAITVPAHGMIYVRIMGGAVTGATTVPTLFLGVMNGATVLARITPQDFPGTMNATTQSCPLYAECVITGLTPGAMNVDLAYGVEVVVAATNIKYGGPNDTTTNNAWGGISFQIWDPQSQTANSTLAVDANGRVDVIKVAGTTQTARDIGASVLLSAGTGAGQLDFTSGVVKANATQVDGAALTAHAAGKLPADLLTVAGTAQTAGDLKASMNTLQADTDDIQARLPAALVSGRMDSSVGAMAAKVLTATAIAADAITDAKVAADVTIASVTGAVGSVTGAVGSVTGAVGSVTARVTANTDQLAGQTVTAAAGVTFPTSVASPTNITAGTITTATNLTNAPTAGDFTATMKTSIGTAVAASAVASVTGNVGGNVTGSVGSVTGLTASNLDATVSSRLASASYTAPLTAAATRTALGLASANLDTQLAATKTVVDAVQVQTDKLTFTVANKLDANVLVVNGIAVTGSGTTGVPWGPA